SFKDRGMTVAMSKAVEAGARIAVCASTGNTSASAAAYAAKAGLGCAVLVPAGKVAAGKMAQTLVHGARLLEIDGNFDAALDVARVLADRYPDRQPGVLGAGGEGRGRIGRPDPRGDGPGDPERVPPGRPRGPVRRAGLVGLRGRPAPPGRGGTAGPRRDGGVRADRTWAE